MEVFKLILKDESWKFNGKFPEHYKTSYGKTRKGLLSTQIWYLNKNTIKIQTSLKRDKVELIPKKILKEVFPEGLKLIRTGTRRTTLDKVYESLKTLFLIKDPELMITDYGGTFGMFRKETEAFNGIESLRLVNKYDDFLYEYLMKAVHILKKLYDSENNSLEEFISKYLTLTFNKYKNNAGLGLHMDNVIRYDTEGPICVISIGPDYSYIDLVPTIIHLTNDNLTPVRIKLPEGSMYIMDGLSRLEWSHAIPYDSEYTKIKFSIMFKCSRFPKFTTKQSQVLDTEVYESSLNIL